MARPGLGVLMRPVGATRYAVRKEPGAACMAGAEASILERYCPEIDAWLEWVRDQRTRMAR